MPKWYDGDFGVFGFMPDGSYHEFASDTEYVEALRDEDTVTEE